MLYGVGQVFQRVTIGSLPDIVLLDIFDFYQVLINKDFINEHPWNWEKLVHVCRRWRYITFESPVRLNLQLFCTEKSPVRKLLDVWPPFPLVIRFNNSPWMKKSVYYSTDNIIAALERRDRVREIEVHLTVPPNHLCERIFTAMEESFPALRSLSFMSEREKILPNALLNGSAPCLRRLTLWEISIPSLPQLLSSTNDLTCLDLTNIPNSGYIPPETMAISLSALPKLESLSIIFKYPTPHLERRNRTAPVQTRFFLPALTVLKFEGESKYFEVLAARFDAPLLDEFVITFFHHPVFDIPQTIRFFSHLDSFSPSSLALTFKLWDSESAFIIFPSNRSTFLSVHSWRIKCYDSDRQVISVAQICNQILPFHSSVKSLTIRCGSFIGLEGLNSTLWLQLFHSFPSVQSLQIPLRLEPSIASALESSTLAAAEVFPSLDSLSIVGNESGNTVQQPIQSFIAGRQRSGRSIAVSHIQQLD
jgi:hypothetical protein